MKRVHPSGLGQRVLSHAIAALFPAIGITTISLPARAACDTDGSVVTCSGAVTGFNAGSATGLTVNILNGATINAPTTPNPTVSVLVNADSTITNDGTIRNVGGSQATNFAVSLNGSNTVFTNNGSVAISVSAGDPGAASGRTLRGIISSSSSDEFSNVQIVNTGSITLSHAGATNGQLIYGGEALDDITLDNSGTISATRANALTITVTGAGALQGRTSVDTTARNLGIVAGVDSDDDTEEFHIINRSGGVIEATGQYTAAISGRAGAITIVNSGTIRNNSGAIAIGTQSGTDDGPGLTTIENEESGVIQGDIYMVDGNLLRQFANNHGVTGVVLANQVGVRDSIIANEGTITGNFFLGSGTHLITNEGTITGNISVDQNPLTGITNPGLSLTLINAGTFTGNVTLKDVEDGHNAVVLIGDGFTGNLTAANGVGRNELYLQQGNGTLHGSVSNFSLLQVGGQVTVGASSGGGGDDDDEDAPPSNPGITFSTPGSIAWTIQGVVSINGSLDLGRSQLTVTGGVNLGAGSLIKTTVFGPGGTLVAPSGNIGQLVVGTTGTAGDGTKIVPTVTGTVVRNGDWYRLGHNGAGGSVFDSLPSVENSGLITWQVQEDSQHDLLLAASVLSPSSIPGITQGAAGALTSLFNYTGSNPQLIAITSALQSASTSQVQRAGEQLRPEANNGSSQASLGVSNQVASVVGGHLEQLRLASNGQTGVSTGDAILKNGVWMQGFGFFGNQNERDGIDGYKAGSAGVAIGGDTLVGAGGALRLGGAFSYARTNVDGDGATQANTTDIQSYILTGYGTYDRGRWYIDGSASVGQHQYDTRRVINSVINDVATSSHDGKQFSAKAEFGYPIGFGKTSLIPVASLSYVRLDQDGYTESSTSGAALAVDSNDTNSLRTGLGAKYRLPVTDGEINSMVELRAIWLHELGDTSQDTTATFAAGGAPFTTNGMNIARDSLNIGGGFVIAGDGEHQRLTVNYDAEVRSGYIGQTVSLQFRYQF
jgi:outer membrane autotransporter protein